MQPHRFKISILVIALFPFLWPLSATRVEAQATEELWEANAVTHVKSTDHDVTCRSFSIPNGYQGGSFREFVDKIVTGTAVPGIAGECVDTNNESYSIEVACYSGANLVKVGRCPVVASASCLPLLGDPTEMPSRALSEIAEDWVSARDSRFAFRRNYRSDWQRFQILYTPNLQPSIEAGRFSFGAIWEDEFNELLQASFTVTPNTATYHTWRGQVFEVIGSGPNGVGRGGNPYTFGESGNSTATVDDGTGRKVLFARTPGSSQGRYFPAEITWPDGYKITITRSVTGSSADNRILAVTDNKGQRALYSWTAAAPPSIPVILLSSIEVDSEYVAPNFNPQAKIIYSYLPNSLYPNRPKLSQVDIQDLTKLPVVDVKPKTVYSYGLDTDSFPPRLLTISERLINADADATITYEVGSGRVVRSTQPGNVGRFDFASGPTSAEATNSRQLKTTYVFSQVDGISRLSQVDGAATANCLSTATSAIYTPNVGNPAAPPGYIFKWIEKNGSVTRFLRDSRGLVLTKTEDFGGSAPRVTNYTWDSTLRLPATRKTSQAIEDFSYSTTGPIGLLTEYSKTDNLVGSPTFGQKRTWTYNYTTLVSGLRVLTSVDGPGLPGTVPPGEGIDDVIFFTYSASGALASITDAMGLVTNISAVNKQGQPTQVDAPDGVIWGFTYDIFGRLLTSTIYSGSAGAKTATYTYDTLGQLVSMTNSLGKTWAFEYDSARRMSKATSPFGDVARYSYDTLGNLIRTEYGTAAPSTTFFEDTQFDELGRLLKTLGAQGQIFQFSHDVEDNLTTVTDTMSNVDTNGYDALNRLIQVIDRDGFTTTMASNDSDLTTQYTDPRSIQTQFTYNGFGEVVTEVSADRGTTSYTYDHRGLVKTMTDARGVIITYGYNHSGQVTLIDYPTGVTPDIAFTYGANGNNAAGKLKTVTQGTVLTDTVSYPFNTTAGTSRVVEVLGYPNARTYTVDTTFDTEGNVKFIDYPSGDRVDYLYDGDNRVTRVRLRPSGSSTWENLVTSVNYRPNGPIADLTFGDLFDQIRTYDSSYRLTRLRDKTASVTLRDVSFGYSLVDNLTSITDAQNAANNETFGYTPRENLSTTTGPYGAICYTYDGVGNRITGKLKPGSTNCLAGGGLQTDTYTYPATKNRLTSVALGAGGSRAFTYNLAGSVTSDTHSGTVYNYIYDKAGRMITSSLGGVLQAEYVYNHRGQQAIRRLFQPNALTIHSVFGPDGNRIAEYNETTGALLREYVWLDGVPVAVREGGTNYYVRVDHISRPVFATNSAGTKVWTATYLPFGGVQTTTGSPITLRFPGQWFQSENGLHQNWMRDYDPSTGRYLEADPLGLVDGASVYGYVKQNPGRWVDPKGAYTEVVSWEPRGWGASSFGHASISVNGTSYSFGHGGMTVESDQSYFGRNNFRDGFGQPIDLTPKQEAELVQCLKSDQGEYSAIYNNCTDPIERCLAAIGYPIGDSTVPMNMLEHLRDSNIPQQSTIVWHEPSDRSECGCAPWAK